MTFEKTINNIVSGLRKGNFVAWCGAGISYSSGLPTAKDLVKEILKLTKLNKKERDDIEKLIPDKIPFEKFMETILSTMDENARKGLLHVFSMGQPCIYHKFLARLVKEGLLKTICTTNFDTHIETALMEQEGYMPDKNFVVLSEPEHFVKIDWKKDIVRIIKLHGSIETPEKLGVTLSRVAEPGSAQYMQSPVKQIFADGTHSGVLVFGYSFSDHFDISPVMIQQGESGSNKLIINFDYTVRNDYNFKVNSYKDSDKELLKYYKNHFRLSGDTEEIVRGLCKHLPDKSKFEDIVSIKSTKPSEDWIDYLKKYFKELDKRHNDIAGVLFAGSLLALTGKYKESVKYFKKVLIKIKKNTNDRTKLIALQNLAGAYIQNKEIEKARKIITKAIPIAKRFENGRYQNYVLEQLSSLFYQTGDLCYNEALGLSNTALDIAKKQSNTMYLLPHLSGIATCWMKLGDFDAAARAFSNALKIIEKSGDLYRKAELYSNIASMYSILQIYKDALAWYNKAIKITSITGDIKNEGIYIMNRAIIFAKQNNNSEALAELGKAKGELDKVLSSEHPTMILLGKYIKQVQNKLK